VLLLVLFLYWVSNLFGDLFGVRHMALSLLRQETGKKASVRREQNIATMNIAYLEQVFSAGFPPDESKK